MSQSLDLSPGALVIASHNSGKVSEINELLVPHGILAQSAAAFGLPIPLETETTFEGNARLKARAAAAATGIRSLSDDSGLEVAALNGAPGVYSADWAEPAGGGPRDFSMAMERVAREIAMRGTTDRRARFVCCLALAWPDGTERTFRGEVSGVLVFPPRGERGFGYDPIFVPDGETQTFGEMDPARKHAMSHRADAFSKLIRALGACRNQP